MPRLRMKRVAQRQANFEHRRQNDLAYWREARAANIDGSHVAAAPPRPGCPAVRNPGIRRAGPWTEANGSKQRRKKPAEALAPVQRIIRLLMEVQVPRQRR